MVKTGVSYYGCRIPWRAREDLQAIADNHCTFVVHTFSEEDHEFYAKAVGEIVRETRALGLEAWLDPWGVGQAFGGETYSALVMKRRELCQVSASGDTLPICCLNHPGFREYLTQWAKAAVDLGAQVLFWDEPHFFIYPEDGSPSATRWACRCAVCQAKFQAAFRQPMPMTLTPDVRRFKEDSLVEFLTFLCDEGKRLGVRNAMCYLPFENSSTFSDWARVAALPGLDIIGTDPYWRPHQTDVAAHVGRAAQRIAGLAAAHQKEGQIWILNFNIKRGEEGRIPEAIEAAYAAGIRNLAAWSYYGAGYISLASDDPQRVWETLGACYAALHARK
ncbi:MAG: hypothetical protein HY600_06860 [Candidatus Omnitrophica bacterium]|nr:hypothetical protein [Candidatus Omnitrophota bacterium]